MLLRQRLFGPIRERERYGVRETDGNWGCYAYFSHLRQKPQFLPPIAGGEGAAAVDEAELVSLID